MAFRLYNTMSSQVEEFHSLRDKEIRMYACGPTVYDYGHIGNFRTFIAVDLLQRFLRQSGYTVRYVMNITDLDDKIIRNAAREDLLLPGICRRFESLQLLQRFEGAALAEQARFRREMLPAEQPAHELSGGDGLDLFAQRSEREAMNAGEQAALAPFRFAVCGISELATQNGTGGF